MGISRTTAQLMMHDLKLRPCPGHIASLGRMHIYFTWDELQLMAKSTGFELKHVTPATHRDPALRERGYISDDTFFTALGFTKITRIDVDNYEQIDVILDLNTRELPEYLYNTYDYILDSGTIEHVFHLPQVLTNIHNMLKVEGRIFHLTPAANCLDHGFYCLSPTLFLDYYSVNNYQIQHVRLCQYHNDTENASCTVYNYITKKPHQSFNIGQLDDMVYYTNMIATKQSNSTAGIIPQQNYYVDCWQKSKHTSDIVDQQKKMYRLPNSNIMIEVGCSADRFLNCFNPQSKLYQLACYLVKQFRRFRNSSLNPFESVIKLDVEFKLK